MNIDVVTPRITPPEFTPPSLTPPELAPPELKLPEPALPEPALPESAAPDSSSKVDSEAEPVIAWREDVPLPGTAVADSSTKLRPHRLYFTFVSLVVLAIFAMITLVQPSPGTYLLPLWVADLTAPGTTVPGTSTPGIDAPSLTHHDRTALTAQPMFTPDRQLTTEKLTQENMLTALDALAQRPHDLPLVVYLSARVCLNSQDRVYICPADADMLKPTTMIPLLTVLEKLQQCPAGNKLLVLDLYPMLAPRLGYSTIDLNRYVHQEVEQAAPTFYVLCSSSPTQVPLSAPELQRTIFAYYFEEGLRGWADGVGEFGQRDGRISVSELAAFISARVDHWAWRNRRQRQTPVLLGKASDFDLGTLRHRHRISPQALPEPIAYPDWLVKAWQENDRWLSEQRSRQSTRVMQQFQQSLLALEQRWLAGDDDEQLQKDWLASKTHWQTRFEAVRQTMPKLNPYSIALAQALGQQPDRTLLAPLKEQLTKLASAAAQKQDKPTDIVSSSVVEFLAKLKDKTHLDLAWATWEAACTEADLSREKAHFLATLLHMHEPELRFAESVALQRLGTLAQDASGPWPVEQIKHWLQTVRQSEKVHSRFEQLHRLRPWVQAAAGRRHDAEQLLLASHYTPTAAASSLFAQVNADYASLSALADALQQAQQTYSRALLLLPDLQTWLDHSARERLTWDQAVLQTEKLLELVNTPQAPVDAQKPSSSELRVLTDDLQTQEQRLRSLLDTLQRPFQTDYIVELTQALRRPRASPTLFAEATALLASPNLLSSDRKLLRESIDTFAYQLLAESRKLDEQDYRQAVVPTLPIVSAQERAKIEQGLRQDEFHRVYRALALLRLSGVAQLVLPEAPTDPAQFRPDISALRDRVTKGWTQSFPAVLNANDVAVRERASHFSLPTVPSSQLDDPRTNPQRQRLAHQYRELQAWLGSHYQYLQRDQNLHLNRAVTAFYTKVSEEYLANAEAPTQTAWLEVTGDTSVSLDPNRPVTVALTFQAQQAITANTPIDVRVLNPDTGWLAVLAPDEEREQSQYALPSRNSTNRIKLRIRLLKQSGPLEAAPHGLLVQARYLGKTYHFPLHVSYPWAEKVDILFANQPNSQPTALSEYTIRSTRENQSLFVFLHNPGAKRRNLLAQVFTGGASLAGADTKVALAPRETKLVRFAVPTPTTGSEVVPPTGTPPATPRSAPLRELTEPLDFRVVDADNPGKTLAERKLPIRIANPAEYVQVTAARFVPSQGDKPNRLEVRLQALPGLQGLPVPVELVLSDETIPGYLGGAKGTFKGLLAPNGDELILFAEGLTFASGTDEEGAFSLIVDGQARAYLYRTTFARSGETSVPRRDQALSLRFTGLNALPSAAQQLVRTEVDNPPTGSSLELSMGTLQAGLFQPEVSNTHRSPRQQQIWLQPFADNGALLVQAQVNDWSLTLDTSKATGRRALRARLLDSDRREIHAITRQLVIDDTPPKPIRFLKLSKQAKLGSKVVVHLQAEDDESGVAKVQLFVGTPIEKKLPPNIATVLAQPTNAAKTVWSGEILLPEKKGLVELTAYVVNSAGLTEFSTTTVELLENEPIQLGVIQGTVVEGARVQTGLEVTLKDEKGAEKKTKTDDEGKFTFEGIPPGKYTILSAKPTAKRKAQEPVTVQPGATVTVTVKLFL